MKTHELLRQVQSIRLRHVAAEQETQQEEDTVMWQHCTRKPVEAAYQHGKRCDYNLADIPADDGHGTNLENTLKLLGKS
uniref:Uncharacterized protein n=1 Tax=Timema genevievae TaxID=629358 RepID=A0A7R9K4A7_TIMGE|nr:unnamed protein product [Timema genevievae]